MVLLRQSRVSLHNTNEGFPAMVFTMVDEQGGLSSLLTLISCNLPVIMLPSVVVGILALKVVGVFHSQEMHYYDSPQERRM